MFQEGSVYVLLKGYIYWPSFSCTYASFAVKNAFELGTMLVAHSILFSFLLELILFYIVIKFLYVITEKQIIVFDMYNFAP